MYITFTDFMSRPYLIWKLLLELSYLNVHFLSFKIGSLDFHIFYPTVCNVLVFLIHKERKQ